MEEGPTAYSDGCHSFDGAGSMFMAAEAQGEEQEEDEVGEVTEKFSSFKVGVTIMLLLCLPYVLRLRLFVGRTLCLENWQHSANLQLGVGAEEFPG